jgi:periplasmic divalent cation tolerance protein
MTDKIVVLSTCDSEASATVLARHLVEKRLAACVNIIPGVRSVYRWKGQIEDAGEWILLIKSSRALFDALRAEVTKMHSYEVPEVIALQIIDGAEQYLNWLERELAQ